MSVLCKQRLIYLCTIFRLLISYTAIHDLLIESHTRLAFVTKSTLPYLRHTPVDKYCTTDFQTYTKRE